MTTKDEYKQAKAAVRRYLAAIALALEEQFQETDRYPSARTVEEVTALALELKAIAKRLGVDDSQGRW